jgi:hypothetical protein
MQDEPRRDRAIKFIGSAALGPVPILRFAAIEQHEHQYARSHSK